MERARIDVTWRDSRVAVARVKGEVDLSNADELVAQLSTAAEEASLVVLDLSELRFIGSTGIHAIFRLGQLSAESGGRTCLVVPEGSPIPSPLLLVDLPETVSLYRTVADAIEHSDRPSPS